MAQNSKVKTDTIIKLVLDYYKLICSEKTYKSVEKKLSDMSIKQARDFFLEPELNLCTIIEPFQDISFESIRTAAKMLKVPLDEYVTIKTEDGRVIKTDRPVPVGISYFQFLEHFSSQYMSVGGAKILLHNINLIRKCNVVINVVQRLYKISLN